MGVLKEYISALFNYKFDIKIDEDEIGKTKKSEEVIKVFATEVDKWRKKLINTGREEGIQKGREEVLLQTTENMLKAGADVDFIQRVTKLSRRKILELRKKIKKN